MDGGSAAGTSRSSLRWGGACLGLLAVMAGLALLPTPLAYALTIALPIPFLWLLFRNGHLSRFPAPWWAGLALWATVGAVRAGAALLLAGGAVTFQPQHGYAAAGSLFPFVALAILWGEGAGGRAFGLTLRRGLAQALLGIALAVILQCALRLPHIVAGGFDLRQADLLALGRDLPFELMVISLGEEALFRGYLQTTLQRRYPWWFAVVLTSVLFGVWHIPAVLWHSTPYAAFAIVGFPFAFGLLTGVMVRLTGSIVGPVVAHAVYNAINAAFP